MDPAISIRPYQETDIDEMAAAVRESLGELVPWMLWVTATYSAADAAAWVRATQEGHQAGTMHEFAIIDGDGRYAGGCGINQINWANGVANLGYWVRTSASGRGIAPAAARKVMDWAFSNTTLNRLEIVIAVDNIRSRRAAEKAGAHYDARLRKRLMVNGRPSEAFLFSFIRPDPPQ